MTVRVPRPISRLMQTKPALRFGWTTGACATAASKAAFTGLLTGAFPDPVEITLPRGQKVAFSLAETHLHADRAMAGVVKDAGDDPDVTHGALIRTTVWRGPPATGVTFRAGEGVGTVTRAGLPIPPGEPAINPMPRQMITAALAEVAASFGIACDAVVEISIPGGAQIAERTLNGRLGIEGGLSILGTTGVVVPFSCAAWIHSIHRGIDVARAAGLSHVAGATGRTSEEAVQKFHSLPDMALMDMGDFVGGMLKYIRAHPVARVTVAGGIGKITKLAQGRLDLHSRRGAVDMQALASFAEALGADNAVVQGIAQANTAAEAFALAHGLGGTDIEVEVLIFDSTGALAGQAGFTPGHERNRLT